jgi:hypothetical protein
VRTFAALDERTEMRDEAMLIRGRERLVATVGAELRPIQRVTL